MAGDSGFGRHVGDGADHVAIHHFRLRRHDHVGWLHPFLNVIVIVTGIVGVLLAMTYLGKNNIDRGEYYPSYCSAWLA